MCCFSYTVSEHLRNSAARGKSGTLLGSIFYILILIVSVVSCGATLKKLPKGVADIAAAYRAGDRDELMASLGVALFYWVVSILMLVVFLIPIAMRMARGYGALGELLRGF